MFNVFILDDSPLFTCQEIELGISQVVLVGGSENMSQSPYAVRDIRFGTVLGQDLKVKYHLSYQ